MRHRHVYLLSFLSWTGVLAILYLMSTPPTLVGAQTDCTAYNTQCPALQEVSAVKVQGPIKYWFDDIRINGALTSAAADNLRERVKLAADDWASKTGVVIQKVDTPEEAKVNIIATTNPIVRAANGRVEADPSDPSKIRMSFSNEWGDWNNAGRDRLASHEWGHVLGFGEVGVSACSSIETIMRQFSSDNATFDDQLKGVAPLPAPGRPNTCDACAAKDKQAGQPLGTSCPAPTPTPNPCTHCPCCDCFGGCGPCHRPDPGNCPPDTLWDPCGFCARDISPVVIDVAGDGFNLTNAIDGVDFDINGNGTLDKISWTAAGSDDAWLALDRDMNNRIDTGRELFGNFTSQPVCPEKNGFLALAMFDTGQYQGNNDGWIDASDNIFASLRLWRDTNHNGISEASELHTLPSLGVAAIRLDYRESRRTDEHGNQFRYRAKVKDDHGAQVGRWAWDVFLIRQ